MKATTMTTSPATAPLVPLLWLCGASVTLTTGACLYFQAYDEIFVKALIVAFVWPWALPLIGSLRQLLAYALPRIESASGFDLDGDGFVGAPPEPRTAKQLVYVRTPDATYELPNGAEITTRDLRWLIEQLPPAGQRVPGWRQWQGRQLPSGTRLTEYDEQIKPIMELLARINAISERGNRSAGTMALDHDEIKAALGL